MMSSAFKEGVPFGEVPIVNYYSIFYGNIVSGTTGLRIRGNSDPRSFLKSALCREYYESIFREYYGLQWMPTTCKWATSIWFYPYTIVYWALYTPEYFPELCDQKSHAYYLGGMGTQAFAILEQHLTHHWDCLVARGSFIAAVILQWFNGLA